MLTARLEIGGQVPTYGKRWITHPLSSDFVYMALVMDVFTHAIRGWGLGKNLDGDLCLSALRRAGKPPQIRHSD